MAPIMGRGHLLAATLVVVWSCAVDARAQCELNEMAKVFPVDSGMIDAFGRAVAVDGDVAVAGAYNAGNSGHYDGPGAVYIYRATSDNWLNVAELLASHQQTSGWLGYDVDISGDVVSEAKLEPPDVVGIGFGRSVSLHGDGALIEAWGEWTTGERCPFPNICRSGSAYVFHRSAGRPTSPVTTVLAGRSRSDSTRD